MTEDEAKTKTCCGPQTVAMMIGLAAPNLRAEMTPEAGLCIASRCMAWRSLPPLLSRRWEPTPLDDDRPVEEMELSSRTFAIVQRLDLRTVGDVRRLPDTTFLRTDNCGRKSLNELRELTGPHRPDAEASKREAAGFCGLAGAPK